MDEMWKYSFLGNTLRDWAIALAIMLTASAIILIFSRVVIGQLKRVAARTKTTFDDLLIGIISRILMPLAFVYSFYFGLQYLRFRQRIQQVLHLAVLFVTTFFIIRLINEFVSYSFETAVRRNISPGNQINFSIIVLGIPKSLIRSKPLK